jgi:L-ascorbate metabolism protein UlaG (beta-lactamase superfamily)
MGMVRPVIPNSDLVVEKLPHCNVVLVTHSHWDHLMDVPEVLRHTGAVAFGSPNTCRLLRLLGVPESQVNEIQVGDKLSLGAFNVEVIHGQHSRIPFEWVFNGKLKPALKPPLRLQDYRMDICLGYCITVAGKRMLVCAAEPQQAEVLFPIAQESRKYYQRLFKGTQPKTVVPIHWDNFIRPLSESLRRFVRPGRLTLKRLTILARQTVPQANVIIPEIFREYTVNGS